MSKVNAAERERMKLLSDSAYQFVFEMLDAEIDVDGVQATKIATAVQSAFDQKYREIVLDEHESNQCSMCQMRDGTMRHDIGEFRCKDCYICECGRAPDECTFDEDDPESKHGDA